MVLHPPSQWDEEQLRVLGGMRVSQVLWECGSSATSSNVLYTSSNSLFSVSLPHKPDLILAALERCSVFMQNYDLSKDG